MAIELKVDNKQPSPGQKAWLGALNVFGGCSVVCWTLDEVVRVVMDWVE